jgi:mRNA-degrading endonuclease toxin of MazEF toxin-antitoxin module
VSAGPAVAAGSYTLSVVGTSGALTHSTSVDVTVQATPGSITGVIGTDQALGCIDNSGIVNALSSKLAAAEADINAGKIQEAINTLKALLNQLNAQAGKHIATTCMDSNGNTFDPVTVLIADVKALLASLGVTIKADPIMGSVVNWAHAAVPGATVHVLNASKKIVATATTDAMGFYYFAATESLSKGASYSIKIVFPNSYHSSTPSSQTFTWQATSVLASNFVLK